MIVFIRHSRSLHLFLLFETVETDSRRPLHQGGIYAERCIIELCVGIPELSLRAHGTQSGITSGRADGHIQRDKFDLSV